MKAKFTILGEKVHNVGYRAALLNRAFSIGINNFSVFNSIIDGRQAVVVLVDSKESLVNEIRNFIKSYKPERAVVEEIKEEEYEGEVPNIERAMQAFQVEQWNKGIPALLEIRDNTRLIPEIAENTRLILSKQDEHIQITKEILSKQDEHIQITKEGFENVTAEVKGFRELHEELRELREEFEKFKESVVKVLPR